MAQQTAVEWFHNELYKFINGNSEFNGPQILEQAKKMFEQQIMEAFDNGDHCIDLPDGSWKQKYDSPEQYYNETYGK
jgi:hypothetical protein